MTTKDHIRECLTRARTGDSGAHDRLRSAIVGHMVNRFGTRRIGRFADLAAAISRKNRPTIN